MLKIIENLFRAKLSDSIDVKVVILCNLLCTCCHIEKNNSLQMASQCEHCKEFSVDSEDQTCRNCGIVNDEIKFGSEYNPASKCRVYSSKYCHLKSAAKSVKPQGGLLHGLNVLDNLCHIYTLTPERHAEITSLFKLAYNSRSFSRREHIGGMAACCLLHIQESYNEHISIKDVCNKLGGIRIKVFYKLLKSLRTWISEGPYQEIFSTVHTNNSVKETNNDVLLESVKTLVPVILAKAVESEKALLIKKTIKLLELANSCWLVTGRSPKSVIIACAFLCWKSLHLYQKNISMKQFLLQLEVHDSKASSKVTELKEMLFKLGCEISAFHKTSMDKKDIIFYLDYILENSKTLRYDFLEKEETQEEMNQKEYDTFRTKKAPRLCNVEQRTEENLEFNASDIEISDTEICTYIRSDAERQFIKDIQNVKKEQI